jgi:PilZ domain
MAHDELLALCDAAIAGRLSGEDRARFRALVDDLLESLREDGSQSERRRHLRAPAELDVHVLSPDEHVGLATSTIGSGGISIPMAVPPALGTMLELSIKVPQRQVPLFVTAEVVWTRSGRSAEVGAAFRDTSDADRELLEAIAVQSILTAK